MNISYMDSVENELSVIILQRVRFIIKDFTKLIDFCIWYFNGLQSNKRLFLTLKMFHIFYVSLVV